MNTYTQILYHVVFCTKYRQNTMVNPEKRNELYAYMGALIQHRKSRPIIINGVEDHLHLLFSLHPTISLSQMVKELKIASSRLIKETKLFPKFHRWQDGFAAFSVSNYEMEKLVGYIQNQVTHHAKKSSRDELESLLNINGIVWDPKYLD